MEAKNFRTRARANLAGNWGLSIAVALVAALMGGLITGLSFLPEVEASLVTWFPFLEELAESLNRGYRIGNFTLNFRSGIFGLATFLIGGVLQMGYADYLLKQHDGNKMDFSILFSRFDHFGTGFAQRFLRGLYVTLWSLLFIIPGIIKSYAYAMTPFILAEHPQLTASQAIRLSGDMMDGYKAELFILDLSFIGWNILAALTFNLGNIVLNPYKNAAYAAFYRQLQAEQHHTSCE